MSEPMSASTSTSSLLPLNDDTSSLSNPSTGTSSPRARSPAPKPRISEDGHLAPPAAGSRALSRSPSPLGLIPIHKSFSKLIHKHELPRKVLHVSIGFLGTYLYRTGVPPSTVIPILSAPLAIITSADLLRFNSESFNAFYIRVLGAFMRESEVKGWNGVIWYLAGTIVVLVVFPKDVATLSILLLSWCDTAASTFGRAYGARTARIRKGKSVAGSLAAFVVGAVTTMFFLGWVMPTTPLEYGETIKDMWAGRLGIEGVGELSGALAVGVMSVVTGVIASASEVVDAWGLDDNVVIPILSAVGVWSVLKVFG